MSIPKVSVVLPVYNGENYIRVAVDSVLAQTFTDFELIIIDNASTDATYRICESYAKQDVRIRYSRNSKNVGGARNHLLGFQKSHAKYVKFLGHDDAWEPTLLEKSVEILDQYSEIVGVYPKSRFMDGDGSFIGDFESKVDFRSLRARDRLRAAVWGRHGSDPTFALTRSAALAKTKLLEAFVDSDRVLLARLALQGPLYEIPEYLFYRRLHAARYGSQANQPSVQLAWFDPTKVRKLVMPAVRLYFEYIRAAAEAELRLVEKAACIWVAASCVREQWWRGKLKDDLSRAWNHFLKKSPASHPVPGGTERKRND